MVAREAIERLRGELNQGLEKLRSDRESVALVHQAKDLSEGDGLPGRLPCPRRCARPEVPRRARKFPGVLVMGAPIGVGGLCLTDATANLSGCVWDGAWAESATPVTHTRITAVRITLSFPARRILRPFLIRRHGIELLASINEAAVVRCSERPEVGRHQEDFQLSVPKQRQRHQRLPSALSFALSRM